MDKKRKNDCLLIAIFLVIGILGMIGMRWYKKNTTAKAEAVITVNGEEYGRYLLADEQIIEVDVDGRCNTLCIKDGQIYVTDASCPDHLCKMQGKIRYNGETLICLPNEMVVEIVNGQENDNDIDASTN